MSDSSSEEIEYEPAVVIDNGSGTVKAGIAGDEHPRLVFPSVVARPRDDPSGESFIGPEAQKRRDTYDLSYPLHAGKVENWDDVEKIWEFVFFNGLDIDPETRPVMLTEAPLNPLANREKMAEIMFETFGVPALHVFMQGILACYSAQRTTGLVLDSGDGVTHVVPIVDGYTIQHAIRRLDLGGRTITDYLTELINARLVKDFGEGARQFTSVADKELIKDIKEKHCRISAGFEKESTEPFQDIAYHLPDGSELRLGTETIQAGEAMFNPSLVRMEAATSPGVSEMIEKCILANNVDNRVELSQNIILSGGNTLFRGFEDRVRADMMKLKERLPGLNIKIVAKPERQYCVWQGGAIRAMKEGHTWITKAMYQESGAQILHEMSHDGRHTGY